MHVMMRREKGEADAAVEQRKREEEDERADVDDFGGETPESRHGEEFEIDHDHARGESQETQVPIGEYRPGGTVEGTDLDQISRSCE